MAFILNDLDSFNRTGFISPQDSSARNDNTNNNNVRIIVAARGKSRRKSQHLSVHTTRGSFCKHATRHKNLSIISAEHVSAAPDLEEAAYIYSCAEHLEVQWWAYQMQFSRSSGRKGDTMRSPVLDFKAWTCIVLMVTIRKHFPSVGSITGSAESWLAWSPNTWELTKPLPAIACMAKEAWSQTRLKAEVVS